MKIVKKLRFAISLASLLVCLMFSSVSVFADQTYDLSGQGTEETTTLSKADQKTFADGKINMATIKSLFENYVTNGISQIGECTSDELQYIGEMNSSSTDMFENFAKAVGDDPCGAFKSYDADKISVTDNEDGTIDATTMVHFKNKDLKMIMHISLFDTLGPQATSIEFGQPDAEGATMADAAVNTLMGMGTVFAVLIFISLLISCFKIIPKITEAKAKKKSTETVLEDKNTQETVPTEENLTDDTELIAVIAAAIAASENTSTDSFVVRSIRRR